VGAVILGAAVVVEAALAVHGVSTRSRQRRARAVTRTVWCAGLLLVIGVRLIEWSPRYYALLLVSVLMGGRGLYVLLRARPPDEAFEPWLAIRTAAMVTLLMFVATLPAIVFPEYEPVPTTGEHRVATVTRTYVDPSRLGVVTDDGQPRRLTVQFWFPDIHHDDAGSSHALLVYSHGGTGLRTANASLFAELASHGNVVASIDHTHHSLYTTDTDGQTTWIDRTFWRELNQEDARADREGSLRSYRAWLQVRIDDLDFVIDHVLREAASTGRAGPYALVDSRRIGVMGHSLGGSAALGIGRTRDDIGAVVALESPLLWDIEGVEAGQFVWNEDPYPVPMLHIYSDSSWGSLGDWPQYAANHALLQETDPTVASMHLAGVGHFGLTDLALTSPLVTRLLDGQGSTRDRRSALEAVNEVTLEFVETHLQGEVVADERD